MSKFLDILNYQPFIVPTELFEIGKIITKGKSEFVTVRTKNFLVSDSDAIGFAESKLGGHWLMPILHIAGSEWKVNPQVDEDRYLVYLLVKAK